MPEAPTSHVPTETIQLSTATWLKLIGVLIAHTVVLLYTGLQLVNKLDNRLTRVETRVEFIIDKATRVK